MQSKRKIIINGLGLAVFFLVFFGFVGSVFATELCVFADPKCSAVGRFSGYPSDPGCRPIIVNPADPESYKSYCTNPPTINSFETKIIGRYPPYSPTNGVYSGVTVNFSWDVSGPAAQKVSASCFNDTPPYSSRTTEIDLCSAVTATTCNLFSPYNVQCGAYDLLANTIGECTYDNLFGSQIVPASKGSKNLVAPTIVSSDETISFYIECSASSGISTNSLAFPFWKSYPLLNDITDDIACCGSAAGSSSSTKPISGLCNPGTVSAVSQSGLFWSWTCKDVADVYKLVANANVVKTCTTLASLAPPCTPDCSVAGSYCGGNAVWNCNLQDGCLKKTKIKDCADPTPVCNNGECVARPFNVSGWKEVAP